MPGRTVGPAVAVLCALAVPWMAAAATSVAEFESGQLTGVQTATSVAGYRGSGYVTGFDQDGDAVEVRVVVPREGVHEVRVRYNSPFGEKGYELTVDGVPLGGMLGRTGPAEWAEWP